MKGLKPGQVPLERAFSKLGIASRTESRAWILSGRVKVNGDLRTNPGFGVNPETAIIELDGKKIGKPEHRTFLLHKPRGVVTTRVDEKGRPTVFSLCTELGLHLIAVGRLDWATSGLLILTNDTKLSDALSNPENKIVRTYTVTVRGEVTEDGLERIRAGIQDGEDLLTAEEIILRKASGKESHLLVRLTEGKNREIRRLFLAIGHEVLKLKRIEYGGLSLGDTELGKYRELNSDELKIAFPSLHRMGKEKPE
ncbi:MAG: rRNA pseudouridine synthase [Cryobacterium sp.]|nr:rRNA pseudouridine synthase [Oligoflexia bacterium]